jgi:hypothetical protein
MTRSAHAIGAALLAALHDPGSRAQLDQVPQLARAPSIKRLNF